VEGTHHYEQRLDLFLFTPFNAILTIGIAAKLRGESNGQDPRDFPACFGAPNRKVDGFIGKLTQQSDEGALPRQAVDFIREPEHRVLNILDHFTSASTFHLELPCRICG
jgi:hypothetical protein